MSIKVIYGDEPYKIEKFRKKSYEGCSEMNISRYVGTFDSEVMATCNTLPFFSDRRVVLLDSESLKDVATKEFDEYLSNPCSTTDLLCICKKVDSRLKVTKQLEKQGILKACNKCTKDIEVQKFLLYEVSQADSRITPEAMQEFCRRINYFGVEDMTLLKAVSYLKNVISYSGGEITVQAVKNVVPEFEAVNTFGLAKLIASHDMGALLTQAKLINEKDAIGAASAVLRELRIAYKQQFFSLSEIGAYKASPFASIESSKLKDAIGIVTEEIAGVKDGSVESSMLLQETFNRLLPVL